MRGNLVGARERKRKRSERVGRRAPCVTKINVRSSVDSWSTRDTGRYSTAYVRRSKEIPGFLRDDRSNFVECSRSKLFRWRESLRKRKEEGGRKKDGKKKQSYVHVRTTARAKVKNLYDIFILSRTLRFYFDSRDKKKRRKYPSNLSFFLSSSIVVRSFYVLTN